MNTILHMNTEQTLATQTILYVALYYHLYYCAPVSQCVVHAPMENLYMILLIVYSLAWLK